MPMRTRPQGTGHPRHAFIAARAARAGVIAALTFLVAVATALTTAVGPAAAAVHAGTPAAAYLARHPGGQLLNSHEVSYDDGAFVVTLGPDNGVAAAPDCPSGWFCFWDGTSYSGPRGKLSSCGWQNLATYDWEYRVASAYYNLDRGAVQFRYGNTGLFQVGVSARSIPNAGAYKDLATTVYRYC